MLNVLALVCAQELDLFKEGYIFSGIFGLLIVLTLFLLSFVIY